MKKLSIVCSVILALALITAPAFAQQTYRIDILESGNPGGWGGASLKTFDALPAWMCSLPVRIQWISG